MKNKEMSNYQKAVRISTYSRKLGELMEAQRNLSEEDESFREYTDKIEDIQKKIDDLFEGLYQEEK